jgi:hypothetical protein
LVGWFTDTMLYYIRVRLPEGPQRSLLMAQPVFCTLLEKGALHLLQRTL